MKGLSKRAKNAHPREQTSAYDRVGRLASFGLVEPWQVALLMPTGYDDLRQVAPGFEAALQHEQCLVWAVPSGSATAQFSKGVPRTVVAMTDRGGATARATVFGDTKVWLERMGSGDPGVFLVHAEIYNDSVTLRVIEEVEGAWVGRLRPKYPGKPNYMASETVREKVIQALPHAIPRAAAYIEEELAPLVGRNRLIEAAGLPGWTLEQVLEEAHLPATPRMAEQARTALRRIAAFAALAKVQSHKLHRPRVRPIDLATRHARIRAIPFTLTADQVRAIEDIAEDLAQPVAARRTVCGDVGCGKSSVFCTAAVSAVDAGARVAILMPSLALAEQVHREIEETWPDARPVLVTGEGEQRTLDGEPLLVGTTALLHRETGEFDLVVVDEEQKFSVEQREALASTTAHLVIASATCIPRSQALARYGAVGLSEIRQSHSVKTIETKLWGQDERRALLADLQRFLSMGDQLLVVYPMREPGEEMNPLLSVQAAAAGWERMYPGRVRVLTGEDSDQIKSQVMADMRNGRAQILLATTVVEVGITLPGLRRAMIVAPERHGLTTLHQLRGRVARKGGQGWCDLFPPLPLKDKQKEKLEAFLRCKDGFDVAELDLRLRGFGDLSKGATKQSGADDCFLFGDPITPEHVEAMAQLWGEVSGHEQVKRATNG